MNTKGWIVAGFLVAALVCFILVGFGHGNAWDGHDLIGLGLASSVVAAMVHVFMSGSELKG